MNRCKQYMLMTTVIAILLAVGCQPEEKIDNNEPGINSGKLQFSPSLSEAHMGTRAGESDNNILQEASAAGVNPPHIVIDTYTGTPGSSLKAYFSDELGYFKPDSSWDVNSEKPRFLPSGGMNLYAYFATDYVNKGNLDSVKYISPTTATDHPQLTFTVAADDALDQVDLIAAKVEGITRSDVLIPFRHILSQINFGVKGIDGHQITVTNIRINEVMGKGSFDYKTWKWTPNTKTTYPYYFPNRIMGNASTGLGKEYQTQGTPDDSQNTYLFGDGGKFGPGNDTTFLYAQTDFTYTTKDKSSAPLHNSLMLLPQEITKNTGAIVTFDYVIKSGNHVIRSSEDNTVRLDTYYDWEPNYRYVYIFKFNEPQVTFDVLVEPWQYYDGDDGIIDSEELNSNTLFLKYIRPIKPSGNYSVLIGTLLSDFNCDWSQYTLDNSFTTGQSFTLSFENLNSSLVNGKSVIIKPPFGFTATPSSLNTPGKVTFTPIKSYYSTSVALNSAISSGIGNHEFYVSDVIKLEEINFTGSTTAESSLTLHSLTPYSGALYPEWQFFDGKAVYYPNDYALTKDIAPYSYTVYTVKGLKKVFDWMNSSSGTHPGGTSALPPAERMQTNITLAEKGKYNLAEVYKANATDSKPEFVPIGNKQAPYTGNFDAKEATVSNLYINTTSYNNDGFFGTTGSSGSVKHLHLANASVTSADWNVGGLIGLNGNTVTGCSVSGSIQGGNNTGGIAGQNNGSILSCYSTATINGTLPGGIAGNNRGQIKVCYTTNGTNVAGVNNSKILTSYYVASSDIDINPEGVTRAPSIAALNGKIPQLNAEGFTQNIEAHFVSGDLNATPPSIAAGKPDKRKGGGVLKGTFIQNWFALSWDEAQWDTEMALLATLGMEYLVIDQVMVSNGAQYVSWYPASQNVLVNDPSGSINWGTALEKCMTACEAHGLKVFIGTFFDSRYWDDGAAITNPTQWINCIATANNVMDELTSSYFNGSSSSRGNFTDVLAGWYFPYEVDDLNFKTSEAQTLLKDGIKSAMDHRTNHPNQNARKPYLFSPFMNGSGDQAIGNTMDETAYAALWGSIMNTSGFQTGDILSPQDCIGIRKLTLEDLTKWMPALKKATPNGVEFWINVELFGPGGNASFLTTKQIPASKEYAAKLISFSYPIYYSPNSDRKEGNHDAYKSHYDEQ